MATEIKQIILRKGIGTPTTLDEAEAGFATDTNDLFVGTGGGAVVVVEKKGHTHVKSNIIDFAHTHVKSNITDFAHTHVKAEVTDFAHGHVKSDISDFSHTHNKVDIVDFTHGHTKADISDFPTLGTIKDIDLSGSSTQFLRGDGTWSAAAQLVAKFSNAPLSNSGTGVSDGYAVKYFFDGIYSKPIYKDKTDNIQVGSAGNYTIFTIAISFSPTQVTVILSRDNSVNSRTLTYETWGII